MFRYECLTCHSIELYDEEPRFCDICGSSQVIPVRPRNSVQIVNNKSNQGVQGMFSSDTEITFENGRMTIKPKQ